MVVVLEPNLLSDFKNSKKVIYPHTSTIKLLLLKNLSKHTIQASDLWTNSINRLEPYGCCGVQVSMRLMP